MLNRQLFENIKKLPWLYNLEATSRATYGDQPPGTFDVNHFLQNANEGFRKTSTEKEPKKKTLILSDYGTIPKEEYGSDYLNCISSLISEGFDLYTVEPNGEFVKITIESLNHYSPPPISL